MFRPTGSLVLLLGLATDTLKASVTAFTRSLNEAGVVASCRPIGFNSSSGAFLAGLMRFFRPLLGATSRSFSFVVRHWFPYLYHQFVEKQANERHFQTLLTIERTVTKQSMCKTGVFAPNRSRDPRLLHSSKVLWGHRFPDRKWKVKDLDSVKFNKGKRNSHWIFA